MALVNVKPMWSNMNSTLKQVEGVNAAEGSACKGYTVLFNTSSADNVIAAQTANDGVNKVPALGDVWSAVYPTYRCLGARVLDPLGPFMYRVVADFAQKDSKLLEPARKGWSGAKVMEPVEYDALGALYKNVVNDRIPGIQRPFYDLVYKFARYEASDAFASSTWRGTVNSVAVTLNGHIIAIGKCLMDNIEATRVPYVGYAATFYWDVTYTIIVRTTVVPVSGTPTDIGWKRRELNKGKRYKDTAGATTLLRVRDSGVGLEEAPLAANGTLLAAGADHIWLLFDDFVPVDWTTLGLY